MFFSFILLEFINKMKKKIEVWMSILVLKYLFQ